ncbi:MAG: PsbP-related protein [bacterium]|nr:PsbP-related protein [bacterium]
MKLTIIAKALLLVGIILAIIFYAVYESGKKIPPVATPSSTPIITPNIDTLNLKSYKNEDYGYEIKYPSHWDINSTDISLIQWSDIKYKDFLDSPFINPLSIKTIKSNNKNIYDWVTGKAENDRNDIPYQKIEDITIAGTETFLLHDPVTMGTDIEVVFVFKNDNVYRISAPVGKNDEQFKQILSTFKFLNKQ